MASICFSVPGSQRLPILLKFSRLSAQISGFSADFHRKLLDIVKQHQNNAEMWADSPVIKVDIGEHKFDGTGSAKTGNWKAEKIRVLVIQKVAKTGYWKKNSSGR